MNIDCLFVAKLRFGVGGSFAEQKKTYEQVGCNRIENGAALWDDLHEKYQKVFTKNLRYREQDDHDDYYCYVAHYYTEDWVDFDQEYQDSLAVLGYNQTIWDDFEESDSSEKDWDELTPPQQEAAGKFCFNEYTWNAWREESCVDPPWWNHS